MGNVDFTMSEESKEYDFIYTETEFILRRHQPS